MAVERPTRSTYDAIVALYRKIDRDNPKGVTASTHTEVGRILRIPTAVARRAWHKGWQGEPGRAGVPGVSAATPSTPTLPPVKDLMLRERVLARAKRNRTIRNIVDTRTKELEAAVDDAAEARALEGFGVRQLMMVGVELQANTLQLLLASQKMRESVIEGIQAVADDPRTPISKRLQIMNTLSEIAERDSKTLERAQLLERRFMGEVESRQKVESAEATTTPERVFDELTGLIRALGLNQASTARPVLKTITVDAKPVLPQGGTLDDATE